MKPDQILASLSQLDHQKRPVTRVAIVFFTLVCLSLGGMQAWSVYRARQVQIGEARISTSNLTRNMSEFTDNALERADAQLSELVDRVSADGGADNQERLQRYMAERVARSTLLSDLSVYDQEGTRLLSASALSGAGPDVDKALLQHRAHPGGGLHIGAPQRHPSGGEWVLPLSRRLGRPGSGFGGIAVAHLRIKALDAFYQDLTFPGGSSIMVALSSGQLVLTRPDGKVGTGADMRATTAYKLARYESMPGTAFRTLLQKGREVEYLYTYRRLKSYPLLVTVATPTSAILAEWWDSAYLSTAGVSLLMLIQLWLGIRLYGQVALRDRLEKERRSLQKLLVKKSRSLRRQAFKDALTGIANRRQFDTRLLREFNRAATEGRPLSLVILDVDYFKKYNDQHGHPAGDECLKAVAGCINNGRRRSQDLAARLGGEEFAILLPDTDLRGAIAVAESVRKTVASRVMDHIAGMPHSVTVSCGVHAIVPALNMAPADLVDAADRALYLAKTSGRNRVRAEGAMPPGSAKRFSLVVNK